MPDKGEIEERFWKALKSDRTVMLGLAGERAAPAQPMTISIGDRDGRGPMWTFTAKSSDLARSLNRRRRGIAYFSSKGHNLFAAVEGVLARDNDRATIDRLWNPFVAAWFEGGKDDPELQLIRFEPRWAHIWLNDSSLAAGVKLLIGVDPKDDYKDKVAEVRLS